MKDQARVLKKSGKPRKAKKLLAKELAKQAAASQAVLTKGESSQGMIVRVLERTMHASENASDREFARLELDRLRGIL
jgi:hypothetical protein